jgi:hypothetical protein
MELGLLPLGAKGQLGVETSIGSDHQRQCISQRLPFFLGWLSPRQIAASPYTCIRIAEHQEPAHRVLRMVWRPGCVLWRATRIPWTNYSYSRICIPAPDNSCVRLDGEFGIAYNRP